jgi:hypothetical protein
LITLTISNSSSTTWIMLWLSRRITWYRKFLKWTWYLCIVDFVG